LLLELHICADGVSGLKIKGI